MSLSSLPLTSFSESIIFNEYYVSTKQLVEEVKNDVNTYEFILLETFLETFHIANYDHEQIKATIQYFIECCPPQTISK